MKDTYRVVVIEGVSCVGSCGIPVAPACSTGMHPPTLGCASSAAALLAASLLLRGQLPLPNCIELPHAALLCRTAAAAQTWTSSRSLQLPLWLWS